MSKLWMSALLLPIAFVWTFGCSSQATPETGVVVDRVPVVKWLSEECNAELITVLAEQIVERDLGRTAEFLPVGSQTERLVVNAGGNALFVDQAYPEVRGYYAARVTCPD